MIISNLLLNSYIKFPNKIVLSDKEKNISYSEFKNTMDIYSKNLLLMSLDKGDRVCLILDNSIEYIYCFFALTNIGCVVIPMDKNVKNELITIVNDAEVKMIITEVDKLSYIENNLCNMKSVNRVLVNKLGMKKENVFSLDILKLDCSSININIPMVTQDDIACLIYTSGTIKNPKGVMLTHFSLTFNVIELNKAINTNEKDIFFNILPFYHCYGLCTNLLLPVYLGSRIILHNNYFLNDIVNEMNRTNATVLSCVPTMLDKLKNLMVKNKTSKIKYISSGAPLPYSVIKYYKEVLDIDIINAYGSSETNTIAINNDCYNSSKYCVGKILPSIEIKILGENNNELCDYEHGEIVIKTPKIMNGYYKMEQETESILNNGWFWTGDVGYITNDKFLYITGRKKDMFCVAGKKVYRNDLEDTLMASGYFKDVYIDSIKNESRGEKIIAYVVTNNSDLTKEEIFKYCRNIMASHKVPKEIYFCDSLYMKRKTWKNNTF